MKPLLYFCFLIFSLSSNAQTILCQPHGEALYSKMELSKPDYEFSVPWYSVKLENKYNQIQNFTVNPLLLKDQLKFVSSPDRSELIIDFGKYKGPGVYHAVQITLQKGSAREDVTSLMCEIPGDFSIQKTCDGKIEQNAFFQSVINRDLNQLESALACDVDVNTKNEFGCTALLLSADPTCGQKLPSPIAYQPLQASLPIVDLLTNSGALLEIKDPVSGERALHKFAKLRDRDVVSLLLDLEADVNAQDSNGYTPLMRAVENNDKFMVQRIVEAGPDLSLKNKEGETALMIAQALGFKKLESLLQEPSHIVEVSGQADGLCSPQEIHLSVNMLNKVILKASASEMFLMEAPGLGLNLMAGAGGSVSQNIMPKVAGTFTFTCGVHGASKQTHGQILVQ